MSTLREAAEKALKALDVATTPLAKDRQEVLSAMAALRAELAKPDAPMVQDGWQLVPVEPTPQMVAAYLGSNRDYWQIVDEKPTVLGKWRNGTPEEAVAFAYASMLAAAPRPAPAEPQPIAAQASEVEALRKRAETWELLYMRAINEANDLTNYVEDRPELSKIERKLVAIEAAARAALKEQAPNVAINLPP